MLPFSPRVPAAQLCARECSTSSTRSHGDGVSRQIARTAQVPALGVRAESQRARYSADDLSQRRVPQHVGLAAVEGVLVDHLDQRGPERASVAVPRRFKRR